MKKPYFWKPGESPAFFDYRFNPVRYKVVKLPRYVILFFIALFAFGVIVLYFFNPLDYAFYPRCPFFWITGLKCPFCGGLRATHELTHGNLKSAFQFNALLVLMIPLVLVRILVELPWFSTKKDLLARILAFFSLKVLTFIVLLWWIARNLWSV